ncbi:MAG: hypothetical protein K8R79_08250 [Calditrichales bacterium]|nr:hypothetical protein [Calditrichales bacterium]
MAVTKLQFWDSGAFHFWKQEKEVPDGYIDCYAKFIKKKKIKYYANLDDITSPEKTWENQQYLETKYKLRPIPTVHFKEELIRLQKYLDNGHDYIGLGGLVYKTNNEQCEQWLDQCFDIINKNKSKIRVHGFGMGKVPFLYKYPWHSVDFRTINQLAGYKKIMIPVLNSKNEYNYKKGPKHIALGEDSKDVLKYENLKREVRPLVEDWINHINTRKYFYKELKRENISETIVAANYFYYQQVFKHIQVYAKRNIILYLSGSNIEMLESLGIKDINIMPSYKDHYTKTKTKRKKQAMVEGKKNGRRTRNTRVS